MRRYSSQRLNQLGKVGYLISAGYGKMKDTSFRIAHMGDVSEADLNGLLTEMDRILKTM